MTDSNLDQVSNHESASMDVITIFHDTASSLDPVVVEAARILLSIAQVQDSELPDEAEHEAVEETNETTISSSQDQQGDDSSSTSEMRGSCVSVSSPQALISSASSPQTSTSSALSNPAPCLMAERVTSAASASESHTSSISPNLAASALQAPISSVHSKAVCSFRAWTTNKDEHADDEARYKTKELSLGDVKERLLDSDEPTVTSTQSSVPLNEGRSDGKKPMLDSTDDEMTEYNASDGEDNHETNTTKPTTPASNPYLPQIITPLYTTYAEDEKRRSDTETLMKQQRATDFSQIKNPSPAEIARFNREWQQDFCLKRHAAGAPKTFLCSSYILTGQPCDSAQEYGAYSLARPGISQFLGHNKAALKQVPLRHRVVLCRKHYQTWSYGGKSDFKKAAAAAAAAAAGVAATTTTTTTATATAMDKANSWTLMQIQLLRAQIGKFLEWRPDATFTIQPTVGMKTRINSFYEKCGNGRTEAEAAAEVDSDVSSNNDRTAEKSNSPITPVRFAIELQRTYCRKNQSADVLLALVDYIEGQILGGVITAFPAVEFLLDTTGNGRDSQLAGVDSQGQTEGSKEQQLLAKSEKGKRALFRSGEVDELESSDMTVPQRKKLKPESKAETFEMAKEDHDMSEE